MLDARIGENMVRHDRTAQIMMNLFLILLSLACVLPFLLLVMSSLTEENTLALNGYSFWPEKFSLETYVYIFKSSATILKGYAMSIFITVAGTLTSVILTILFAYPLSRKELPGRTFLSFVLFFTMLFNGGLVPTYMMYSNTFHIKNTIFALIVPGLLMNAFYVIMMRSFMTSSIPDSLIEAAKLDGASDIKILRSVVMPLSKPILVTLVLMIGLHYWNDWQNGLYYVTERSLYTIQMILNSMLKNIEFLNANAELFGNTKIDLPTIGIRMGIAVVAVLPMLMVYPFLQKFFVKGIVIGGVKG